MTSYLVSFVSILFICVTSLVATGVVAAFVVTSSSYHSHHQLHNNIFYSSTSTKSQHQLHANSPLFSDEENNNESDNEFDGFNPFQPGAKIKTKGGFGILSDDERKQPAPTTPGGQISPRQMRMKELTTDLLARLSDEDAVSELLISNEEFLLQQLNNLDAVLESDSVFTPDMSREERYERYRMVMDERIENARAPAAKKALGILRDFVSSRE